MAQDRWASGLPEERLVLAPRDLDGGLVRSGSAPDRQEPVHGRARLLERLLAYEGEVRQRARLKGQRVRVPAIQLPERLIEPAELEAQPAGRPTHST